MTIFLGRTICLQDVHINKHLVPPGKSNYEGFYLASYMMKERYEILKGEEWMHFTLYHETLIIGTHSAQAALLKQLILGDKIGHLIRNDNFLTWLHIGLTDHCNSCHPWHMNASDIPLNLKRFAIWVTNWPPL